MGNLNKVILMGNLTRDPEVKFSNSGIAFCKCGIAVSRKFTKDGATAEETCFIDLTSFGKTAEVFGQYLSKGKPVLVEGRLSLYQWTDEETGVKHSKHSVVVENLCLLPRVGGSKQEQGSESKGSEENYDDVPF